MTINIYNGTPSCYDFDFDDISDDDFDDISDDGFVPNISMDSFTLTINDFSSTTVDYRDRVNIINYVWGLKSGDLWPNYKALNTFNLTLNNREDVSVSSLLEIFDAVMKVNSLRTLRLKFNDSQVTEHDNLKGTSVVLESWRGIACCMSVTVSLKRSYKNWKEEMRNW